MKINNRVRDRRVLHAISEMESTLSKKYTKRPMMRTYMTSSQLPIPIDKFDSFIDMLAESIIKEDDSFRTTEIRFKLNNIYEYLRESGFIDNYLIINHEPPIEDGDVIGGLFVDKFGKIVDKINDFNVKFDRINVMKERILRIEFLREFIDKDSDVDKDRFKDFDEIISTMRSFIDDFVNDLHFHVLTLKKNQIWSSYTRAKLVDW